MIKMEIKELKKFKDEIYGKLGEIIKKEVKQQGICMLLTEMKPYLSGK